MKYEIVPKIIPHTHLLLAHVTPISMVLKKYKKIMMNSNADDFVGSILVFFFFFL